MQETAESVKEYGVLVPALARPREDGGYELIAGHRRKHACELAGLATMPVIVRDIDRDAATIIMVDSNLQRENITVKGAQGYCFNFDQALSMLASGFDAGRYITVRYPFEKIGEAFALMAQRGVPQMKALITYETEGEDTHD